MRVFSSKPHLQVTKSDWLLKFTSTHSYKNIYKIQDVRKLTAKIFIAALLQERGFFSYKNAMIKSQFFGKTAINISASQQL